MIYPPLEGTVPVEQNGYEQTNIDKYYHFMKYFSWCEHIYCISEIVSC